MALMSLASGADLEYAIHGDASAELVVLVPGAGAPLAFWPAAFCESLAGNGLRVARYSHRDTGLSTHFDTPYPIEALLEDLIEFHDELGGRRVHVVGHSMGGYLAELMAARYPERVATVAAISAGPTVAPGETAKMGLSTVPDSTWEVLLKNEPCGEFYSDLPGWLHSLRFLNGERPFDESMATDYVRCLYVGDPRNCQVATHHIHAMSTVPDTLHKEVQSLDCPLLVLHGTLDPLVPLDHGEALHGLAPGSTLVKLQGAGHMFFDPGTWSEIRTAVGAHITPDTNS